MLREHASRELAFFVEALCFSELHAPISDLWETGVYPTPVSPVRIEALRPRLRRMASDCSERRLASSMVGVCGVLVRSLDRLWFRACD